MITSMWWYCSLGWKAGSPGGCGIWQSGSNWADHPAKWAAGIQTWRWMVNRWFSGFQLILGSTFFHFQGCILNCFVVCRHFQKGSVNSKTRWEKKFYRPRMGQCDGKRCRKTEEAVILLGLSGLPSLPSRVCSALLYGLKRVISSQKDGFQICTLFNFSTLALLNMLSPLKTKCTTIASSPNKRFPSATTDNYSSSTTTSTKTTCKLTGGIYPPWN